MSADAAAYEAKRLLFREWLHRPIGVIYIQDRIQRRREGV